VDRLLPQLDENGQQLYERDENGELILDAAGEPIPLPDLPVEVSSPMQAGSATAGRFLGLFDSGGTHEGYLSDAEKKLIVEWLDIGAQYYNDPFMAPQDD
jgi:hypothetical protein